MKKIKYCRICGSKLIIKKIPVSKVAEYYGCDLSYPHYNYDVTTGKKQFGLHFRCPKTKWYNNHTDFTRLNKIK